MNLLDPLLDPIDDNGESEEGCVAIESTIEELAQIEVGTCCGHLNNKCFVNIAYRLRLDKEDVNRKCRGWYDGKNKTICGMFNIECKNSKDAETLSDYADEAGGSLRFSGSSLFKSQNPAYKFFEFEIE